MTPEDPKAPNDAKVTDQPSPIPTSEMSDEHPLSLLLFAPLRGEGGRTIILWGLAGLCIALAILGFIVEPGHHFPLESVPLFYGVFGFLAFAGAVLSGWPLGKWLRRPEGFYEARAKSKETTGKAGEAATDA